LASVFVDDVRDVVNVSSAEVSDAKVLKITKRADITIIRIVNLPSLGDN